LANAVELGKIYPKEKSSALIALGGTILTTLTTGIAKPSRFNSDFSQVFLETGPGNNLVSLGKMINGPRLCFWHIMGHISSTYVPHDRIRNQGRVGGNVTFSVRVANFFEEILRPNFVSPRPKLQTI
jgi:hypothetical protein